MTYTIVPKKERREIAVAFRDYNGHLTKRQKEILEKHEIKSERTNGDHISFSYRERTIITSSNPKDHKTGRNLATKLLRLLEGQEIPF